MLGSKGENLAAEYYLNSGYHILCRNYRKRVGEIDLIAEKNGTIVFVEVKTRSSNKTMLPRELVDAKKQQRIIKTALFFLMEVKNKEEPFTRFDVVEIVIWADGYSINCIENAFEI